MRHSQHHWQHSRLALLSSSLIPLAALAAPTTEVPSAFELNQATPAPLSVTGVRAGARDSDSRTIDLLVEMQQPTAGVQFNERTPRSGSAGPGVRSTLSAPLPQTQPQRPQFEVAQTPPSGLFGSAATPAVQGRSPSVSDSRDGLSARAAGRPSSAAPTELQRWLQLPREIIEYVRENRTLVAGCTALLLLVGWTGSLMSSRRRG